MRRIVPFLCAIFAGVAACDGRLGDAPPEEGSTGTAHEAACEGVHPGASPLRRMTRFEYDNTVRDLLGDDSAPAKDFVADEEALGFDDQATALGVTQALAEDYMRGAERLAANAVTDLPKLLGYCDVAAKGEEACARAFIASFGGRAYRRPLDAGASDRLYALYQWGRDHYGFTTGIELVVQAALQSPSFLYRVELGGPDSVKDEADVVPLTSHEIASRLSYLLWASMPDEALFAAADADELRNAGAIAEQARRMLADPRARAAVTRFHLQWLDVARLDAAVKDPSVYPELDPPTRALLTEEASRTTERIVFDEDGDVAALLTATGSMMNADLAHFYGIEAAPPGEAFAPVTLPAEQRGGVLRLGAVLAAHAKPDRSSPVERGKLVRERLLCQALPPPPAGVVIAPPDIEPDATTREAFEQHTKDPACAACHVLMDPIGFGFEHFDGIGRFRAKDHGIDVDATGDVEQTVDANGPFDGLPELARRLAESEQVRECVATQWFRYGYGRAESDDDRCAMAQLQTMFAASGYRIKELLVALTQTDAFRYRRRIAPDE